MHFLLAISPCDFNTNLSSWKGGWNKKHQVTIKQFGVLNRTVRNSKEYWHVHHCWSEKVHSINQNAALLEEIQIPESGKFLLVVSGIPQTIATYKESGYQYLESEFHGVESNSKTNLYLLLGDDKGL